MREVLLGFDTRVAFDSTPSDWTPARREQYLLRTDVLRPLSVDEAVWQRRDSTLVVGQGLRIETPKWTDLDAALAAASAEETVIAITVWQGLGEPEMLPRDETRPSTIDAGWERLGWDVIEGYFPSAITNCGYPEDERRAWRAEWVPRLNDHHLFDELPPAYAFRDVRRRGVPEHPGFVVMGLYRVG